MNNHLFIFRSQRPDFHDFYVFWDTKLEIWHEKNRENKCCTKNRENRWDTKLEFWHEKCVESNDDEYASERPLYCEVNVNKTNFWSTFDFEFWDSKSVTGKVWTVLPRFSRKNREIERKTSKSWLSGLNVGQFWRIFVKLQFWSLNSRQIRENVQNSKKIRQIWARKATRTGIWRWFSRKFFRKL